MSGGVEADRHLELAVAGADPHRQGSPVGRVHAVEGRHEAGLGDAGDPQEALLGGPGGAEALGQRAGGERGLPHGLELPGRAREHDHQGVSGGDDAARRGADRRQDVRAAREPGLLLLDRAGDVGIDAGGGAGGLDHRERRPVELQRVAGGVRDGSHGQVVVGGPEAPGDAEDLDARGEHAGEGVHQVRKGIADEADPIERDAALVEGPGQRGGVLVGDPAPQDLVAGDEDGRAQARRRLSRRRGGRRTGR